MVSPTKNVNYITKNVHYTEKEKWLTVTCKPLCCGERGKFPDAKLES